MAYNFSNWVVLVILTMVEWPPIGTTEYVLFTKDQLIGQYKAVVAYDRGICAQTHNDIADFQSMTEGSIHCCVRDIKAELKCNYVYNILIYLRLMVPENYRNTNLYYSVERACPEWDLKLLKVMSDINFHYNKPYLFFAWLLYFHRKKMQLYAAGGEYNSSNYEKMKELHFGVSKYFEIAFLPTIHANSRKNPVYLSYMNMLKQLDENSALENLTETCARLNAMSESRLKGFEDFHLDRMHLNGVIVNIDIMNTLITGFVRVEKGQQIADFLVSKMELVETHSTSFRDFVHSLKVVHFYFIRLVKTIMIRILWIVLDELKLPSIPKNQRELHFKTFGRLLNEFASFLHLKKEDEFNRLIHGLSFKHLLLTKWTRSSIVSFLEKNGTYESVGDTENHRTSSLNLNDIDLSRLAIISNKIPLNSDTDGHATPKSIQCGQVFFEFLKKILDGVSFRAIELFDEFDVFFVYHNFQQTGSEEMEERCSNGGEYSSEVTNANDEEEGNFQQTNIKI